MANSIVLKHRLVSKEDINFTEDGSFVDAFGIERPYHKVDAQCVPYSNTHMSGVVNVGSALDKLVEGLRENDSSGGGVINTMTKDEEYVIEEEFFDIGKEITIANINEWINGLPHNLGGHTLTIVMPQTFSSPVTSAIAFNGFSNGTLVLDGNNSAINSTSLMPNGIFYFAHVSAHVIVKNCVLSAVNAQCNIYCCGCTDISAQDCMFTTMAPQNGTKAAAVWAYNSMCHIKDCTIMQGSTFINDEQAKRDALLYVDAFISDTVDSFRESVENTVSQHKEMLNAESSNVYDGVTDQLVNPTEPSKVIKFHERIHNTMDFIIHQEYREDGYWERVYASGFFECSGYIDISTSNCYGKIANSASTAYASFYDINTLPEFNIFKVSIPHLFHKVTTDGSTKYLFDVEGHNEVPFEYQTMNYVNDALNRPCVDAIYHFTNNTPTSETHFSAGSKWEDTNAYFYPWYCLTKSIETINNSDDKHTEFLMHGRYKYAKYNSSSSSPVISVLCKIRYNLRGKLADNDPMMIRFREVRNNYGSIE